MGWIIKRHNGTPANVEPLEHRRLLSATLVADILPLPPYDQTSTNPGPVYDVGGLMLFAGSDGEHGRELWRTDGSAAGTRMVKDLVRGPNYLSPESFTAFNDAVYFFSDNALWRTDGTERGTYVVQHDQRARYFSNLSQLTAFNGALYFTDRDATGAARLWRSDGTPDGLSRILPFGKATSKDKKTVQRFAPLGETLTFAYDDALWRTDGTPAGTFQVAPNVLVAGPMHRVGDALMFAGKAGTTTGMWRTDGTTAGTWLVKAMEFAGSSAIGQGIVRGGELYFSGRDATHGTELWKSDGTTAGTVLLADLLPSPTPNVAQGVMAAGLPDAFAWPSPGLGFGLSTSLVSFIDERGNADPLRSSGPHNFHLAGGRVVFTANTGAQGIQLFATDGTAAGTTQLANAGIYNSYSNYGSSSGSAYREFRNVGDALFFSTQTSPTDGGRLYVTDGTKQGTRHLATGDSSPISGIYGLASAGGSLYFAAYTWQHGRELMRWDQTGGITGFAYDDANGNGVRDPSEMPLAGWRVFLDRNGDGIFNKGENFVFAEEDGAYGFPAFPDGAYAVRVSRPDDDWANGAVAAPVRRGRTTWRDVSAARVTPARETVSGTVINDADFDGTRDGGETGLAGVRVYLDLNRNGHYTPGEPSAFTDAAGDYRIADVPPGRYRVAIPDLGPGFEYTRGVDKTLVVLPGSPHDVDFAIGYDGGNGMIHGVLFNDRDGDGKQDANEPGMPGVTMSLSERQWMNSSNIFGSRAVVTDAGGYYKFPRLRRGEYTLSAAYAAIEWQTPQQQQTVVVPLSPGQRALRSWSLEENGTAQISGKAFVDRNRDGAWGSEDLAAPGWWVYADLDRDGKRDGDEPASQTSSTGAYALTELMSGTYLVRFAPSPGDDWTFTHGNAATEITLTPRQQLRLNAGAAGPPSGVITGTVYYDRDADIITTGDPVKSGVTVFLDLNGNRTYDPGVDRTAVTDADGRYRFTKVPSGPYYVIPIAPTGWAMSTPFRGASVADEVTTEFPALGVSDRGRIPGRLFHDVNRDGKLTLSQGDRFLTDYTVYVDADNDGTLDAGERSTQTTEAGAFIFTALPLESYVVRFIPRADDVDHPVVAGSITVTFPMPAMTLLFAAVTP